MPESFASIVINIGMLYNDHTNLKIMEYYMKTKLIYLMLLSSLFCFSDINAVKLSNRSDFPVYIYDI